ncbi:MAG: peptidase T [Bacteroidetes bacterium]|nr:peptidase T [Bacteroidota bacterium]
MFENYKPTVVERFLKYVKIDTQSDPDSETCPSTEKQKNLGKLLVNELLDIGIYDAHIDGHGYVYATIPSNTEKNVPVICFCSHLDTSPDCSGKDVNPVIHKNYDGSIIKFEKDTAIELNPNEHPELKNKIGNDIITADGTTLLGADNKAGLAEIIDAMNFLMKNKQIKHGKIRLLFTPDEEIGRGVDFVNMEKLGAKYGYTIDGETLGHIENETFSADGATLKIKGVSMHPGFAKNKMQSAIKIASEIINSLPKNSCSPETTEGKEGFIHPLSIGGTVEETIVKFIIRGFDLDTLKKNTEIIKNTATDVLRNYPKSSFSLNITEQYRNMKEVLDKYPQVVDYALEAVSQAGIKPEIESIRGGTDGSRLSFMGLPCPNVFTGGHAFHSKIEWISIQDMYKAVETIVNICKIWEQKS